MSAAHTPGPWHAAMDAVKAGRYNVCPHVTAGGSARGMIDEREIAYANALLIAAAPCLLAALQDLFGADMEHCMMGDGKDDQIAAISAARAAIAKATGAAK